MRLDDAIENIFNMRWAIEHTFFKDYINTYDQEHDLRHPHIISMVILSFEGPVPMCRISEKINLEKSTFTTICNRLIQLGYVTKNQNPSDRREYLLGLTQEGSAYAEAFKSAHRVYISQMVESLEAEDQQAYFEAIEVVYEMTKRLMA